MIALRVRWLANERAQQCFQPTAQGRAVWWVMGTVGLGRARSWCCALVLRSCATPLNLRLHMVDLLSFPESRLLRIAIGAGQQKWDGWLSLQKEDLDLLSPNDWRVSFGPLRADAFLCEHVWEHLSEPEGRSAAKLCFEY